MSIDLTAAPDAGATEVGDLLTELRKLLAGLGSVVVAFSGGADSAFLAKVATEELGPERALCVTAVSPSLADEELVDVKALVSEWSLRHLVVETDELANPMYRANDGTRCAHCKDALLDAVGPLAQKEGATVVLGVNVDDLGDHRPGQQVAARRGAAFPLVEAGFTKKQVREASRLLGLRTWDKPAAACLASRVPYGTPVTAPTLRAVAVAESGLRALGFRELRVRHYGDTARVELGVAEIADAVRLREDVVAAVSAAGYRYVTLDLEGLRSGNLNAALEGDGSEKKPGPGGAT
jgi:pyridinium-3,5-biscarboxylic acid mononucleotide sulfurtransferase